MEEQHTGLSEYARVLRSLSVSSNASYQHLSQISAETSEPGVGSPTRQDNDSGFQSLSPSQKSPGRFENGILLRRPSDAQSVGDDSGLGSPLERRPSFAVSRRPSAVSSILPTWERSSRPASIASRRPSTLSLTMDDMLKELETLSSNVAPDLAMNGNIAPAKVVSPDMDPSAQHLPALSINRQPSASDTLPSQSPPSLVSAPMSSGAPLSSSSSLNKIPTGRTSYVSLQTPSMFSVSWKRRYLVLERSSLYLFRSETATQKELKDMMKLTSKSSVRVSEHGLWVLEIFGSASMLSDAMASPQSPGTAKTIKCWVVKCEDKDDMLGWLGAIRAIIAECPTKVL
ncbi:uncharacterized protein EV422DRAFT_20108 [Fimicolochytrium jonesii]|uniref:uncharacterized protein n=1 Tax=Fimicolochytrium jonesii TaxID=1396493 RepID=UPI0022FE622C|nr:uncharacterized protein EV422DRAFT_20108 [Fimicolochytrium jonesii]KAI8826984.1 hypothetical protein EV422DRAFT_20108 [Fimicolochytrium jonesii]